MKQKYCLLLLTAISINRSIILNAGESGKTKENLNSYPSTEMAEKEPSADMSPPKLKDLTQPTVVAGLPLEIKAKVTDNTGVVRVPLVFKTAAKSGFEKAEMVKTEENIYRFSIPTQASGIISYSISAWDEAGNRGVLSVGAGQLKTVQVLDSDGLKTKMGINTTKLKNSVFAVVGTAATVGLFYMIKSQGQKPRPTSDDGYIIVKVPADPYGE